MAQNIITNAFSLNMLPSWVHDPDPEPFQARIVVQPVSAKQAARLATHSEFSWESAVGHEDTARVFSGVLGTNVPANRRTIDLGLEDLLLVGQYAGPRLPEGATTLPEGATIRWSLVVFCVEVDDIEYLGRLLKEYSEL